MLRGARTVFWGAQAPKCTMVALACTLGHNPCLGGTFLALRGTSSNLGGHSLEMPPVAPGLIS